MSVAAAEQQENQDQTAPVDGGTPRSSGPWSTAGLARRAIVIPALVTVVLMALVVMGWNGVQHEREHHLSEETGRAADLAAARLESHITARLTIGRNLRLNWDHGNITGFNDFRLQAQSAHELFGDFQAINWIDPSGVIRWVTPLAGNEAAQGLNIRKLKVPSVVMAEAEKTGKPQVTPPIKLAQGGDGFVAYIPLRRNDLPDGFLNIVFRTAPLIAAALPGGVGDRYRLEISDAGKRVYQSRSAAARSTDQHTQPARRQIGVGNRNWLLSMWPTAAALSAASSVYDELVLGAGVIMALVAGFLIHLILVRQMSLKDSEQRFRDFAESTSDWFWETDEAGCIVGEYDSDRAQTAGLTYLEVKGKTRQEIAGDLMSESDWQPYRDALVEHQDIKNFEYRYRGRDGTIRHALIDGKPRFDADGNYRGHRGTASNITEQKALEQQLQRAQRMEAVGQLTGGVAHDFNNLMAIMIGNAELLEERVGHDLEALQHVGSIIRAVDRGSALTSRLLAFSRQQALSPEDADIGDLIDGVHDLLERTLGETVDLRILPAPDLWPATIDPHQFENSLINLAINARDAMPAGGTLSIETANVTLDETFAAQHDEVIPGDYVRIAVSDTGEGMTPEVQSKVFEPFFTTKEVGKGSGLGLSMVYGFAKQSGGHVTIYSEAGHGTTICLFLPRAIGAIVDKAVPVTVGTSHRPHGSERILVVEDDDGVREIPANILRAMGYDVVEAQDGADAIKVLDNAAEPIDLLFTDVVLPGGMNGMDIAAQAEILQPGIKVLYTSGYTENVVVNLGRLDSGVAIVNKPYRRADLLTKVRIVLDSDGQ